VIPARLVVASHFNGPRASSCRSQNLLWWKTLRLVLCRRGRERQARSIVPSCCASVTFERNRNMTTSKASVVVVVNPYSSGIVICHELIRRGYPVIAVWTHGILDCSFLASHLPLTYEGQALALLEEIEERADDTLETMSNRIRQAATSVRTIAACIAGGEFGVTYADQLSELMGLQSNGTHVPNRRSKKHQQELIKAAGLRSIRQSGGSSLTDVMDFLRFEQYPIVVKPNASAGTEGVKLCHNIQDATEHVNKLTGSEMLNGEVCSDVLCQEFLRGAEYVVDHVSRNGRHVTTAVWVYDKRPVSD
jgi:predicted ATP-grasp superfamily ATP-dependent carboligase